MILQLKVQKYFSSGTQQSKREKNRKEKKN